MNYFRGGIDDLRIFNRALDASEIAAVIPEPATALSLILGAARSQGVAGFISGSRSAG